MSSTYENIRYIQIFISSIIVHCFFSRLTNQHKPSKQLRESVRIYQIIYSVKTLPCYAYLCEALPLCVLLWTWKLIFRMSACTAITQQQMRDQSNIKSSTTFTQRKFNLMSSTYENIRYIQIFISSIIVHCFFSRLTNQHKASKKLRESVRTWQIIYSVGTL